MDKYIYARQLNLRLIHEVKRGLSLSLSPVFRGQESDDYIYTHM